jgi:hypothetical protein
MALVYTITDLPPVWPGKRTTYPKKAPFKSNWTKDLSALDRELKHLGARKIEFALELPRGAMDLRQDGMLKADARPGRAIIISFLDRDGVRHAYPCDTYGWWQDNVHAIAVVLEDLRRAERYGVQSALLRAGFKALPSAGATTPTLSTNQAAELLATWSGVTVENIRTHADSATQAYRIARSRAHPDSMSTAGSNEKFTLVQEAARILSAHHGRDIGSAQRAVGA